MFLDLHMPEMSGQQVLAELRAAAIEVPVVFMSAGDRVRREAQAHGADGYLAKPFNIDDVVSLADRFTSTHSTHHPEE